MLVRPLQLVGSIAQNVLDKYHRDSVYADSHTDQSESSEDYPSLTKSDYVVDNPREDAET